MKHVTLIRICLSASTLLLIFTVTASSQIGNQHKEHQKQEKTGLIAERYREVLDIVFPRDESPQDRSVYSFVLRFTTAAQPETQIIIRRFSGHVQVVEYAAADELIFDKVRKLLLGDPDAKPAELARSVRIIRRELTIPSLTARKWHESFFKTLEATKRVLGEQGLEFDKSGKETIFLHGDFYNVWYENGLNQISLRFYDAALDAVKTDAKYSTVKWMDDIRVQVGKLR